MQVSPAHKFLREQSYSSFGSFYWLRVYLWFYRNSTKAVIAANYLQGRICHQLTVLKTLWAFLRFLQVCFTLHSQSCLPRLQRPLPVNIPRIQVIPRIHPMLTLPLISLLSDLKFLLEMRQLIITLQWGAPSTFNFVKTAEPIVTSTPIFIK